MSSTATAKKPAARTATKARTTRTTKPAPKTPAKPAPAPKEQPAKPVKTKVTKPEPKTLQEALVTGQAVLVKIRANGTVRSLPYLAPKSEVRSTAVTIEIRRQGNETIEAIAEDMNVSVATVRRYLTGLTLALEVEAGKHNKSWTKGEKNVIVHTVTAKATSK